MGSACVCSQDFTPGLQHRLPQVRVSLVLREISSDGSQWEQLCCPGLICCKCHSAERILAAF